MLEDYQSEINALKTTLNQPNPGAYGYPPPPMNYPPSNPPATPPTGSPGKQGPSGSPGPTGTTPFAPPLNPFGAGAGPLPMSVATGGNPTPPPDEYPTPGPSTVISFAKCGPNETWSPSGCLPNVPTVDYRIPRLPPPPMSVVTGGGSGNPPPPPPPPNRPEVATLSKCPAGQTWTPSGCLADVASTDTRKDLVHTPPVPPQPPPVASTGSLVSAAAGLGPSGGAAMPTGGLMPGGDISVKDLLGQVRLMATRGQLGGPRAIRQVPLLRY